MHPCNRGETPTRSVHENAANRKVATITRAEFCERAELFIAERSSDSGGRCASNFYRRSPCMPAKSDAGTRTHSKAFAKFRNRSSAFRTPCFRVRCVPRNAFILSRPVWCQVRLWFGRQHHDWSLTPSMLRVRGPFRPISCFRSIGPDPTEPGSNGDVPNDASTRGSCRDQTLVLLQ